MAGILLPDGTRCYSGITCRRHGAYNAAQLNNTVSSLQLTKATPRVRALPPIIVPKADLQEPMNESWGNVSSYVDYEYDGYYCDGCYGCETGDDYCRGSVYEGLRITSVSSHAMLAMMMSARSDASITTELLDYAEEVGLNDPANYEIYGVPDYYGQTVQVDLNESVVDSLKEWIYREPNAEDRNGILGYIRSKGVETTGLSPLEAIKKELNLENKGKVNPYVDKATKVSVKLMDINKITVPNPQHYERVEPLAPVPAIPSKDFLGVLIKQGESYILVDGYHRLKDAKNNNKRKGHYIILS